jgi:hypothetical protein
MSLAAASASLEGVLCGNSIPNLQRGSQKGIDMSINGKVALVTDAGQGIGRAIALRHANDGLDIAITGVAQRRDEELLISWRI